MPAKRVSSENPTTRKLPDDLLTVAELAQYLRFSTGTVRRMAREKTLPSIRVGSEFRFRLADVMASLEATSTPTPAAPMAAIGTTDAPGSSAIGGGF